MARNQISSATEMPIGSNWQFSHRFNDKSFGVAHDIASPLNRVERCSVNVHVMSKTAPTEKEISKSFEKALAKGEVTDILGNPLDTEDLVEEEYVSDETAEQRATMIAKHYKNLQGKILTIVDATYPDEHKGKYVKDLVREAFSTQANWSFEYLFRDMESCNADILKS